MGEGERKIPVVIACGRAFLLRSRVSTATVPALEGGRAPRVEAARSSFRRGCPAPGRFSWWIDTGTIARSTSASTGSPRLTDSFSKATADCSQNDVVDFGIVGVRDPLGKVESAADQGQAAVPANRTVQACARPSFLSPQFAPGRPRRLYLAQRADRVREMRQQAMQSLDPGRHVIAEKVARRGRRHQHLWRRRWDGRIGGRVEQRPDDRHSRYTRRPLRDAFADIGLLVVPASRAATTSPHGGRVISSRCRRSFSQASGSCAYFAD